MPKDIMSSAQGTGWYLASWPCLCRAVVGHGGGRPSTALHRHGQLAKYHPVPCADDIMSLGITSSAFLRVLVLKTFQEFGPSFLDMF